MVREKNSLSRMPVIVSNFRTENIISIFRIVYMLFSALFWDFICLKINKLNITSGDVIFLKLISCLRHRIKSSEVFPPMQLLQNFEQQFCFELLMDRLILATCTELLIWIIPMEGSIYLFFQKQCSNYGLSDRKEDI